MIKKELNPEQGKRLIECLNEIRMTQKELAETTGYTQQHINNIVKGKRNMSIEAARKFSEYLHVREEYLLCEDGFKTEDEMCSLLKEIDTHEFRIAIQYLATLGLEFKPKYSLFCSLSALHENIAILSKYIEAGDIANLKEDFDFDLSNADFTRKYGGRWHIVNISSPLNDTASLGELGKNSTPPEDTQFINVLDKQNLLGVNYEISTYFMIFQNGEYITDISAAALQDFLIKLDDFSRLAIKTLIIQPPLEVFLEDPENMHPSDPV